MTHSRDYEIEPSPSSSSSASSSLCLSGATPYRIATPCAIGYYCPNYNASNPATYPQVCPATDKCTLKRLQTWFCTAQGTYEPVLCPKGYYCPTPTEIYLCPEGYFCPRGQYEPIPCGWMTHCPEGSYSKYESGSHAIVAIVDILVIVLYFAIKRMKRRHLQQRDQRIQTILPNESQTKKNPSSSHYLPLPPADMTDHHNIKDTDHLPRKTSMDLNGSDVNKSQQVAGEEKTSEVSVAEMSHSLISPSIGEKRDAETARVKEISANDPIVEQHVIDYHCPLSTELLCQNFDVARGRHLSPIEIRFENLTMTIPLSSLHKEKRQTQSKQPAVSLLFTVIKYLYKLFFLITGLTQSKQEQEQQAAHQGKEHDQEKQRENEKQNEHKGSVSVSGKVILQGVTGSVEPGKVLAIMGPSGAGKTVLLTTLLGQQNKSWIRGGTLSVNAHHGLNKKTTGEQRERGERGEDSQNTVQESDLRAYRHVVGYVPQEDIMLRELSIYDNILYSALIRLPSHWTFEEKQRHASTVIAALELTSVQDLIIGTELKRGISGGQRKRCNVGIELAAAPSILFLDEPTSGLDSTSAMHICQLLKDLAHISSLSIAMVIHQPRIEIWHALDELLLLAPGGKTVYQGPQKLVLHYLEEHGINLFHRHCNSQENPADALMDCIAQEANLLVDLWQHQGPSVMQSEAMSMKKLKLLPRRRILSTVSREEILPFNVIGAGGGTISSSSRRQQRGRISSVCTDNSGPYLHCQEESDRLRQEQLTVGGTESGKSARSSEESRENNNEDQIRILAPFTTQVYLACKRSCWKQVANWPTFALELSLAMFGGGVMGSLVNLMYQGILKKPYVLLSPTPVEHLIFLFFFSVGLAVSLAAASVGVSVFGEETAIYRREVLVGHNHFAYYLGVSLAQTPRLLLNGLHFAWLCHIIRQPLTSFTLFFVIIFLIYFAVYGLAAFVSMLVDRENAALLAVVLALLLARMTNKSEIPEEVQWFSASRWAAEAIFDVETRPYRHVMQVEEYSAVDAGYTLGRIPFDLTMMFLVGIFYRVLALIAMLWVNRRILTFPVLEGLRSMVIGGASAKLRSALSTKSNKQTKKKNGSSTQDTKNNAGEYAMLGMTKEIYDNGEDVLVFRESEEDSKSGGTLEEITGAAMIVSMNDEMVAPQVNAV